MLAEEESCCLTLSMQGWRFVVVGLCLSVGKVLRPRDDLLNCHYFNRLLLS